MLPQALSDDSESESVKMHPTNSVRRKTNIMVA